MFKITFKETATWKDKISFYWSFYTLLWLRNPIYHFIYYSCRKIFVTLRLFGVVFKVLVVGVKCYRKYGGEKYFNHLDRYCKRVIHNLSMEVRNQERAKWRVIVTLSELSGLSQHEIRGIFNL